MSHKKKRNIIIGTLCGVLLLMVVGYAAFNSVLKIKGTSNISSNWDIKITKIASNVLHGTPSNAIEPTGVGTLTATFETNLVSPGDSMQYVITITNNGSMNATLEKINISKSNNDMITFETSGLTEGSTLTSKGTADLTVTVTYKDIAEGQKQPDNTKGTLSVTLDYVQEGTSGGSTGGDTDTFTGTIYRNNTDRYLVNGSSINETVLMYYPSNNYSSIDEAIADAYLFENESDCIAQGVGSCSSGLVTLGVGDYVENPSNLDNFYLKHVIENNIVMESYICFVTNTEYCIQGGNTNYFEANKTLLQSQESWFTSNGGSCDFTDSYASCGVGSDNFNTDSSGSSSAFLGNFACYVTPSGLSYCHEFLAS